MKWHARRDSRKIHRWGAFIVSLPFLIVIISGIGLQVKKQVNWIQPPTQKGSGSTPEISFDQILTAASSAPEADISDWDDIDRLDVRPEKGIIKVRAKNRWEVQVDAKTGKVLQVMQRRSDLIESIHDGSWFHKHAKLWIFLPAGLIVLVLWITGIYLFFVPVWSKRKNRKWLKNLKARSTVAEKQA